MNPVPSPNRRLPVVLALLLIAAAVLWSLRLLGVTWILPNSSERVSPTAALAALAVPQGFQAKLYAGDRLLRNPVAMCLDGRGAILVVETSCRIPPVMLYSDDEMACRTWEEAEALRRKEEPAPGSRSERLIRLEDRSGAGVADRRQVLYEGFSPSDGIAAGVLEHEGRVWLANCPKLYLMTPTGEGVAAPP